MTKTWSKIWCHQTKSISAECLRAWINVQAYRYLLYPYIHCLHLLQVEQTTTTSATTVYIVLQFNDKIYVSDCSGERRRTTRRRATHSVSTRYARWRRRKSGTGCGRLLSRGARRNASTSRLRSRCVAAQSSRILGYSSSARSRLSCSITRANQTSLTRLIRRGTWTRIATRTSSPPTAPSSTTPMSSRTWRRATLPSRRRGSTLRSSTKVAARRCCPFGSIISCARPWRWTLRRFRTRRRDSTRRRSCLRTASAWATPPSRSRRSTCAIATDSGSTCPAAASACPDTNRTTTTERAKVSWEFWSSILMWQPFWQGYPLTWLFKSDQSRTCHVICILATNESISFDIISRMFC